MSDKSELITFPTSLDERLSRALSKQLNITEPTLIQSKVIQLALEGKDIVAKARTGSGKTLAYCLPICQKLLNKV
jgi:ATP-dependent RNA helicase DDX56/DBP9